MLSKNIAIFLFLISSTSQIFAITEKKRELIDRVLQRLAVKSNTVNEQLSHTRFMDELRELVLNGFQKGFKKEFKKKEFDEIELINLIDKSITEEELLLLLKENDNRLFLLKFTFVCVMGDLSVDIFDYYWS